MMCDCIKYNYIYNHAGLYTGFLPRGGKLGVRQKEGGEAVRSCRGVVYLEI